MEDIIGVVGVSFVLITYYLLQVEKIDSKGFWYSFLNLFGAVLIMYSLMYNWNLASIIIEIFWIVISAYGVWKYFKKTV
ncbi:MAG: hypothetical protein K8R39_01215 [Arcobacteraceae bacterium]|nr:hypothetical protein [Arcobacteraceae bacterium]